MSQSTFQGNQRHNHVSDNDARTSPQDNANCPQQNTIPQKTVKFLSDEQETTPLEQLQIQHAQLVRQRDIYKSEMDCTEQNKRTLAKYRAEILALENHCIRLQESVDTCEDRYNKVCEQIRDQFALITRLQTELLAEQQAKQIEQVEQLFKLLRASGGIDENGQATDIVGE